jgi:hypothetical protein
MRKRRLIWYSVLLLVLALVFAFLVPAYLREAFLNRVRSVQIGDTREEVERELGTPSQRFPKGSQVMDQARKKNLLVWLFVSESPETWSYGTPFTLRWFGPAKGDVLIEFDEGGTVSRIEVPDE